jgi:hypothetical protein
MQVDENIGELGKPNGPFFGEALQRTAKSRREPIIESGSIEECHLNSLAALNLALVLTLSLRNA